MLLNIVNITKIDMEQKNSQTSAAALQRKHFTRIIFHVSLPTD